MAHGRGFAGPLLWHILRTDGRGAIRVAGGALWQGHAEKPGDRPARPGMHLIIDTAMNLFLAKARPFRVPTPALPARKQEAGYSVARLCFNVECGAVHPDPFPPLIPDHFPAGGRPGCRPASVRTASVDWLPAAGLMAAPRPAVRPVRRRAFPGIAMGLLVLGAEP